MRNIGTRRFGLISAVLLLLVGFAVAIVEKQTVRYEHPVRAIRGRVTAFGQVMRVVWVDVYDNAQVCLDDSLPPVEQRKRQTQVASVEPNDKGEFSIKHLPRGFYEVEVGNRGMGGYHVLSVLVNVDPKGENDRLCVDLSLEGGNAHSTVARCSAK
jgi:hypothetical protein